MMNRKSSFFVLLISVLYCCIFNPPKEPITCSSKNTNCTITNTYGAFPDGSVCGASEVAYPTSENEVVHIVREARKAGRMMKVATRFSQSIPKWVCLGKEDGIIISTKQLNNVVRVDAATMTMTVESGVTLKQLIDGAAKTGLALPYAPYWSGVTVGGLLGTGAHGSSLWDKGGCVHEYVVEMRIVTPSGPENNYSEIRILDTHHPDLNAAKVSLGLLGVITQVTLKLQPMFKRSITYSLRSDSDLGDQVVNFGRKHEFADIMWYPSQRKALYRIDDRVSSNKSGKAVYNFIPFRSMLSPVLSLMRAAEEIQESRNYVDGKCTVAKRVTSALVATAYGLTNNGFIFTGYPVVGYHNQVQSSGACLQSGLFTSCAWDQRVNGHFFHQTAFSIGLSRVGSFIEDIQKLVAIQPKALCGVDLYSGIFMRYVKASTAYLGKQEDAVEFDITYYRSKDPLVPRLFEDILEEIEQMAFFKYNALPHWGKNRNIAFDGVARKYKDAAAFLMVKNAYDPQGLFSSEWTDGVLGTRKGSVIIEKDGCALEGLCVCSLDVHCAPAKGYFCRPGRVYRDARVCSQQGQFT